VAKWVAFDIHFKCFLLRLSLCKNSCTKKINKYILKKEKKKKTAPQKSAQGLMIIPGSYE